MILPLHEEFRINNYLKKYNMKSLSLVIFWIAVASCLFAQSEVVVKKVDANEKVVTVDVTKTGDAERTVKIVLDEDGEMKEYSWTDEGEIPDDIKKMLDENGIDIKILEEGGDEEIFLDVDVVYDESTDDDRVIKIKRSGDDAQKEVVIMKRNDDGEVTEFEWDGEGEMPAEMKELMEEHDIQIHEGHGKRHRMKKMRMHKDHKRAKRHKAIKDGREKNMKKSAKYKIVTIDEDGNESVKSWTEDGGSEGNIWFSDDEDHVIHLDRGRGGNAFFFSDDKPMAKAYMGAQIASAEDGGAQILDLMKDSPADKAGLQKEDIVQRVNGARARTMDDLLDILKFFDPNDEVELTVLRDGKEKKIKMTLGERPEAYR